MGCILRGVQASPLKEVSSAMAFAKGNQAAAHGSRKEVAQIIHRRLEKEADTLSAAEFISLANRFNTLTLKKRRRKDREVKKARETFADRLPPEEKESLRIILQIERERLEARRKERQDGNTAIPSPEISKEVPSSVLDLLDAPTPTASLELWKPIGDV